MKPLEVIHNSLEKRVIVELRGGKEYRGTLEGYDHPHLNLILRNAEEIIESLFMRSSDPIMIQEYLQTGHSENTPPSADIRVIYIGSEIIGSMKRTAPKGEWRTNFALGADCKAYTLSSEDEELVHQIANRIGIEVAGIDLFPTPDGTFVLEVNACPGWKAFEMANPNINVAEKIVEYLMTKIHR